MATWKDKVVSVLKVVGYIVTALIGFLGGLQV